MSRLTIGERLNTHIPSNKVRLASETMVPLLAISYCHYNSIEMVDSIVSGMCGPNALDVEEVDILNAIELELLLTYLRQNENMLSTGFKNHFQAVSFGLSRPSFLLPQPKISGNVKVGVCALPSCGVTGCVTRCSKCKCAVYCSREHQKEHWKEHRIQCPSMLQS